VDCPDDPTWEFEETTIPAYLILVVKNLCRELGVDFHTLLSNTEMAEKKSHPKCVVSTKLGEA
jgi:hypothetical protein